MVEGRGGMRRKGRGMGVKEEGMEVCGGVSKQRR